MGAIWLPRTLTEQPEYAVGVDRENAFGRVASLAWLPDRESISGIPTQLQGNARITYNGQKSVQTYGGTTDLGFNVLPYGHPVYSISTSFSVFFIGNIANVAVNASIFDFPFANGAWGNPYASFGVTLSSSGAQNLAWFGGMNGATFTKNELAYVLLPGVHSYAIVWDGGSTMQYYRDGELIGSGSFDIASAGPIDWGLHCPLVILNESNSTNVGSVEPGTLSDIYITPAVLGAAHIARLHSNPWQVFKAPPRRLFIASGTSANNLVGTSIQSELATATLSQSIALTAASIQMQSGSGVVNVGIPVSGISAQVQVASGALNIMIPLGGSSTQQQSATGSASVGVDLAGQSDQSQAASGALNIMIPLNGPSTQQQSATGSASVGVDLAGQSDQSQAASGTMSIMGAFAGLSAQQQSAAGQMSISVTLSAASIQQALAQGTLTNTAGGTINLVGESVQSAGASGLMSVGVNLSGNSLVIQSADGTLATIVPLTGVSAQMHSASGGLIITANLSGEALQQQPAIGSLSLRVSINGASIQQSMSYGTLSTGGQLLPDPRFTVNALGRNFTVNAIGRRFILAG